MVQTYADVLPTLNTSVWDGLQSQFWPKCSNDLVTVDAVAVIQTADTCERCSGVSNAELCVPWNFLEFLKAQTLGIPAVDSSVSD